MNLNRRMPNLGLHEERDEKQFDEGQHETARKAMKSKGFPQRLKTSTVMLLAVLASLFLVGQSAIPVAQAETTAAVDLKTRASNPADPNLSFFDFSTDKIFDADKITIERSDSGTFATLAKYGQKVTIDGREVSSATFTVTNTKVVVTFGSPQRINPGQRVVVSQAPGKNGTPAASSTRISLDGQTVVTSKVVRPETPTVISTSECGVTRKINIPQIQGVRYEQKIDGNTAVVTATPETGYAFPADVQSPQTWRLDITAKPCDDSTPPTAGKPKVSITGVGGIELTSENTFVGGQNRVTTTVSSVGRATFESAVVSLKTPGQLVTDREFGFSVPSVTPSVSIERRIIRNEAGNLTFEFYPVQNGVRIPSIELPADAQFKLESRFSFDPSTVDMSVEIRGQKQQVLEQPDVFPTPNLVQISSGDSDAKVVQQTFSGATTQKEEGRVQEIHVSSNVPGFNRSDRWILKVDGSPVDKSLYTVRLDGDDVFLTFNKPQDYPQGTRFSVDGTWSGDSSSQGSITLYGVPPANDYYPLPIPKDATPVCRQLTNELLFTQSISQQADIYIFSTYVADQRVRMPDATDPGIYIVASLSGKEVKFRNGIDFDTTVSGRNITVKFRKPLLKVQGNFRLYVPHTSGTVPANSPLNGCNNKLLGKSAVNGGKIEIPKVCSAAERPIDDSGFVLPWDGIQRGIERRLPPRQFTDAERQRGSSVYVTASTPNGQQRYQTQLYLQTQAGEKFTPIGSPTGWVVNALAFNPNDNWLYGISQARVGRHTVPDGNGSSQYVPLEDPCYPAGHLLQIDPVTGAIHDLGKITGGYSDGYGFGGVYNRPWPNDLWGGIDSGFFDKKGQFWAANSSLSGTGNFYKVDLNTVSAQLASREATPYTRCSGPQVAYCSRALDWAVIPEHAGGRGNFAWGLENGGSSNGRVILMRMNVDTGEIRRFDITDAETLTGRKVPAGLQWGKAWTYGNGALGFGTGSNGATSDVVQIKVENPDSDSPTFELVSVDNTAPTSYNTDGASDGQVEPFDVDLKAVKTFVKEDENGRIHWRIDIKNQSNKYGSSGFLVTDKFPDGYTDIRVGAIKGTDSKVTFGKNTLQVQFGVLPPGGAASIEFSSMPPTGSIKGCAVNVATVLGNENDPNPEDNKSTAEQCPKIEPLDIQLKKVDYENQSTPLDAVFELREPKPGQTLDKMVPADMGKEIRTNADGTSGRARVEVGKYYFIVETGSPAGFSLLPEPILIYLEKDKEGKPVVTFPNQGEGEGFPILKSQVVVKDGIITIPVADVRSGKLPKTGGPGVGVVVLLSVVLIASGFGFARRKAQA
ncbi:MSCRAMM family protein [Corynebacterium resistens]|uniref:MSCRAMM family protein n=1 Tax=Corynebacterium resistens TaxID=258224 RepID=UPI002356FC96|nr:cell surface protein [Corynebacterium resistens]